MSKILSTIIVFFTIVQYFSCLSQEIKIEGPGILDEYFGQIDDEYYFVSKPKGDYYNARVFSIKNNILSIDKVFPGLFPGNNISTQKEKNKPAKHHFKWLIIDKNVYSIYKNTNSGYVQLVIYKYDSKLNTVDSFALLTDKTENNNDFEPIIRVFGTKIGVVSPLDRSKSTFVFATYDIDNKENFTSYFELNEKSDYSCTDFTFNSKNNFLLMLEGPENFRNASLPFKIKPELISSVLVSFIDKKIDVKNIASSSSNSFYRSFKFHQMSDESILFCGLVFESNKDIFLKGYRISHLNINSGEETNEQLSFLKKVKNEELLSRDDIKTSTVEPNYYSNYQYLKEIIPLKNGEFIFISEGHNLINNASTILGSGYSNNSFPDLTFFDTQRNFYYCYNENIFVSCFNETSGILWTTKTVQRFESLTMRFGATQKNKTYFSDLIQEQNTLNLYFPQYPGLLKTPADYRVDYQHPSVAKFSIDLINGEATLKEIDKNMSQDGSECIVVSATCHKNSEELMFWVQNKNPIAKCYYQLYILKR